MIKLENSGHSLRMWEVHDGEGETSEVQVLDLLDPIGTFQILLERGVVEVHRFGNNLLLLEGKLEHFVSLICNVKTWVSRAN